MPGSNSEGGEVLGVEAPPAGAGTRITPPARLGGSAGSPSTPPRRADHEGTAGELSGPPRPLKRRSFDSLEEEELLDFYIREFMDDDN